MAENKKDLELRHSDAVNRLSPLSPTDPAKDHVIGHSAGTSAASPQSPRRSPNSRLHHPPSKNLPKGITVRPKLQESEAVDNSSTTSTAPSSGDSENTHEFQELRKRLKPVRSADGQRKKEDARGEVRRASTQGNASKEKLEDPRVRIQRSTLLSKKESLVPVGSRSKSQHAPSQPDVETRFNSTTHGNDPMPVSEPADNALPSNPLLSRFSRRPIDNSMSSVVKRVPSSAHPFGLFHRGGGAGNVGPQPIQSVLPVLQNSAAAASERDLTKVMKAKLYLLQQNGPNSFLIGGESPDHKFRVVIGPQTCTCGQRTWSHCAHVLFVMLRVFHIPQQDAILWRKPLKNYEVDTLFKSYKERRMSRIKKEKKSPPQPSSNLANNEQEKDKEINQTDPKPDISMKEEKEECSICLMEMEEEDGVVECTNRCQNRFHQRCMAIWFEGCEKDAQACPLCRSAWQTEVNAEAGNEAAQSHKSEQSAVLDVNLSSIGNVENDAAAAVSDRGSVTVVPPEYKEIAEKWSQVLSADVVSRLFSRNWSVRENAMTLLGQKTVSELQIERGGTAAVRSSPPSSQNYSLLECALSMLAYAIADPVYKVFVSALRALRLILSHASCSNTEEQRNLKNLMKSVVNALLIKTSDSNRRTSGLSISALEEIVKGHDGDLSIGKNVTQECQEPVSLDLGRLDYVLECILTSDSPDEVVQWQWSFGRLRTLEYLVLNNMKEFTISSEDSVVTDNERQSKPLLGLNLSTDGTLVSDENVTGTEQKQKNYDRVLQLLKFAVKYMGHGHTRVSKMSCRLFYTVALLSHDPAVKTKLYSLLDDVDSNLRNQILGKLREASDVINEQTNQDATNGRPDSQSRNSVGSNSSLASRRSSQGRNIGRVASQRLSDALEANADNDAEFSLHNLNGNTAAALNFDEDNFSSLSPMSTSGNENSLRDKTKFNYAVGVRSASPSVDPQNHPSSSVLPDVAHPCLTPEAIKFIQDGCPILVYEANGGVPLVNLGVNQEQELSIEEVAVAVASSVEERVVKSEDININIKLAISLSMKDKHPPSNNTSDSGLSCSAIESSTALAADSAKTLDSPLVVSEFSDASDTVLTEAELNVAFGKKTKTPVDVEAMNASQTADEAQDDISERDVFPSPLGSSGSFGKISFKNELAASASSLDASPPNSTDVTVEDVCHCKEEVEKEEDEALVEALQRSFLNQDALPHIRGLSRARSDASVTIHIQDDTMVDPEHGTDRREYREGVHWKRGPIIGTGAYCTCYQAKDVETGTLMAVKQISYIRNVASEQEKGVSRIVEEIRMMSGMNHPNIVRLLGATRHGEHFFLFSEWMPGCSVASLLDTYGAFSEKSLTSYTLQLLRGLGHLHENGIVHRDLKGANLLVDCTGQRLRICDFGAAARLSTVQTVLGEFKGQLIGTIAFMAPEVLQGADYGRSCDIWSVGCIVIQMATAKPAWGADQISNHYALVFKIASATGPPPIPESLSPAIRDLVLRCLDVVPNERPSAKELLKHPLFTMYLR